MESRREIQNRVTSRLEKWFDLTIDLKVYLQTCERFLLMGQAAQAEGDLREAYYVLLSFVELLWNYMPRHPQMKEASRGPQVKDLQRRARMILPSLDLLKNQIDDEFTQHMAARRASLEAQAQNEKAARAKRKERELESLRQTTLSSADRHVSSSTLSDIRKQLDALNIVHRPSESDEITSASEVKSEEYQYPKLEVRPSLTSAVKPPNDEHTFSSTSQLENGEPLKTIFIPATLRSIFLSRAQVNTDKNLETCGILCGALRNNAYFVSTLIIPAQESTSDTCNTTDEEALFTYQNANNLFTIGWIHTHPTQTCFMSSVDLHTHCSYQIMLPEAIAIVCSPSKQPDWAVFRMSDPPGMRIIKACKQKGLFHPHEDGQLYVDALSGSAGGHVKEVPGMAFTVEDQRI